MLSVKNLSKNFGTKELFNNASFTLFTKERVCLIAPNGSGKTTLLKILLKEDSEYNGSLELPHKGSIIAIDQKLPNTEIPLFDFVLQKLPLYKEYKKLLKVEDLLNEEPRNPKILEQYGEQLSVFEKQGGYSYIYEAKKVLEGLGFQEKMDFNRPINTFSGGELRRALLVEVLIQKPDVLILDEPTNHLDLKNILFLEKFLKRYIGTIFFVSHDIEFIENISTHTMSIENKNFIKVKGGYKEYLKNLSQRQELYAKKKNELEVQIEKLKPNIEKFKAGTRSTQAQSMQKRLDKLEEELLDYKVFQQNIRPISFKFFPLNKPFDPVLKIHSLNMKLEKRIFFNNLDLNIKRGEKIAILAPNGTGKSLLLSAILEAYSKKNTAIQYGQSVELGFFKQKDPEFIEQYGDLTPLIYMDKIFSRVYESSVYHQALGRFHLKLDSPIAKLSGGEQSKLRILTILLHNPNFLIMDEPTNHMDITSINGISALLQEYKGTLLIVTHNRQILRDLKPKVYLLQEQVLKSMDFHSWEEIFDILTSYNKNFDSYDPTHGVESVIQEVKNLKQEHLTEKENQPKFLSKELQKELQSVNKSIQKITEKITEEENILEQLKQKQFNEEIYSDFKKAQVLEQEVLVQNQIIEELYNEYASLEEYKKTIEE